MSGDGAGIVRGIGLVLRNARVQQANAVAEARSLAIDDAVKVVREYVRGGRNVNGEFIEQRDEIVSRLQALKEAK